MLMMNKTSIENDEERKGRYDEMGRPERRKKEERSTNSRWH
jgi:hypothetical protein